MISTRSRSGSNRKGLTLSLKKESQSLPKQNSNINFKLEDNLWHIHHPIRIVTNTLQERPPIIIYRQTKNEWEEFQQINRNKRQKVHKMKMELEDLSRQERFLANTTASYDILNTKSVENLANTPYKQLLYSFPQGNGHNSCTLTNSIPQISNFNAINTPYKSRNEIFVIPEEPQNNQNKQEPFKISLIEPIQMRRNHQVDKENVSQKILADSHLNIQKSRTSVLFEKKSFYNSKRLSVDVKALEEIQNKLNKLIDFTKF